MPHLHLIHVVQVVSTCIHLYCLSPSTCVLYRRQNCHHGDMYPLISGYKLLVRDTCRRLHVSRVNAVLKALFKRSPNMTSTAYYSYTIGSILPPRRPTAIVPSRRSGQSTKVSTQWLRSSDMKFLLRIASSFFPLISVSLPTVVVGLDIAAYKRHADNRVVYIYTHTHTHRHIAHLLAYLSPYLTGRPIF